MDDNNDDRTDLPISSISTSKKDATNPVFLNVIYNDGGTVNVYGKNEASIVPKTFLGNGYSVIKKGLFFIYKYLKDLLFSN